VILEYYFDRSAYSQFVARIASEVTNHSHISGVGQFDEDNHVGTRVAQRRMNRMPHAFPTIDAAASRHAMPSEVG